MEKRKTNGFQIAGFVMSLVSSLFCFLGTVPVLMFLITSVGLPTTDAIFMICFLGLLPIAGTVLSTIGLSKADAIGGGTGLGLAGIFLGAIGTFIAVFYVVMIIAFSQL